MQYYKKIEIDNLEIIQAKVLAYVKSIPAIYNRVSATSFNHLEVIELLEACPEIETSFKKYGLTCVFAATHIMYNNNHATVHTDITPWKARINVPILNCKDSLTTFYDGVTSVRSTVTMENGNTYDALVPTNINYKMVDRVQIDKPTVIRVDVPHRVYMFPPTAPRINLSLGFDPDPVFMLEESTTQLDL